MSRRRKRTNPLAPLAAVLAVILVVLLIIAGRISGGTEDPSLNASAGSTSGAPVDSTGTPTEDPTIPTVEPTEPPITKVSTATIGATGDILMHGDVIKSGYSSSSKSYNYNSIFTYFSSYTSALDYAVANLEVTLCGSDNGYSYQGYPNFNSPDAIAEALQDAGFDMLLTANNHSYDTRSVGFHRTQETIASLGLAHTGTRASVEDDNYIIQEINGIQVGMICYTYNTAVTASGSVSLNGIGLSAADSQLVNSFSYDDLDGFYDKLSGELEEMESAGAEATILFIHWGNEYQLKPNATQKAMAQSLCDLGIDVIIGGHPHVVQPMELLTGTTDENHKTVCLYSMGNAVSNQRLGLISSIKTAHTEDGVLMSVTFAKYSDGTVVVESVDLLPTWVNMNSNSGSKIYPIIPLDTTLTDWKTAFDLNDSQLKSAEASYERTMAIVGDGLAQVQEWCASNQAAVEAMLGIG